MNYLHGIQYRYLDLNYICCCTNDLVSTFILYYNPNYFHLSSYRFTFSHLTMHSLPCFTIDNFRHVILARFLFHGQYFNTGPLQLDVCCTKNVKLFTMVSFTTSCTLPYAIPMHAS